MKKFVSAIFAIAIGVGCTYAADSENAQLQDEIRLLKERLNQLEQRLQSQEASTDRLSSAVVVPNDGLNADISDDRLARLNTFAVLREMNDRVNISGNVDVLGYSSDFDTRTSGKEDTSDIIIDQVRLQLDIDVSEYVDATIALQYEDYQPGGGFAPFGGGSSDTDADGDVEIDEAYITIGDEEGVYLIAGRQYFDFGNVDEYGHFINDSLTRQLYETRDTGITGGWKGEGLDFNLFAFNGQEEASRSNGSDNKIDAWGASISYSVEQEDLNVEFGASYINNLLQAQNTAAVAGLDLVGTNGVYNDSDSPDAYGVYATLSSGVFWIGAEYVSALDDLGTNVAPGFTINTVQPAAFTLEAALTCPISDHEYTLAGKFEQNHDLDDAFNNVEEIWGLGVSTELYENTKLSLNYENWNLGGTGFGGSALTSGHAQLYLAELSVGF